MITALAVIGALGLLEVLQHHGAIRIELYYRCARQRNHHVRER
jgi:hypothetical protein